MGSEMCIRDSREAGLLTSEKGHAGGWRLARDRKNISLADVYLALDESLISTGTENHTPACSVEHALQRRVLSVMEEIEQSLIERLSETTISEVLEV